MTEVSWLEDHLTDVFGALGESGIHVRFMQQSATHFGVLADRSEPKVSKRLWARFSLGMDPRFDASR